MHSTSVINKSEKTNYTDGRRGMTTTQTIESTVSEAIHKLRVKIIDG